MKKKLNLGVIQAQLSANLSNPDRLKEIVKDLNEDELERARRHLRTVIDLKARGDECLSKP